MRGGAPERASPSARRSSPKTSGSRSASGINIGDIIIEDGDIYGDGVNIAARLEGLAEPGGICLARNVYNQVKGKVAFGFEPMGEHRVKNIPEPVTVYRLLPDAGQVARKLGPKRTGMSGWHRAALGAVAVALLAAAGVTAWLQPWQHPAEAPTPAAAPPVPEKPSLAVLPFAESQRQLRRELFR